MLFVAMGVLVAPWWRKRFSGYLFPVCAMDWSGAKHNSYRVCSDDARPATGRGEKTDRADDICGMFFVCAIANGQVFARLMHIGYTR